MISVLTTSKSTEGLAQFKAGLENPISLPHGVLLWMAWGLAIFIVLGFIWFLVRHRKNSNTFIGLDSITDAKRINIILQRAVARQATCKLEIFDHRHRNIYHGKIDKVFTDYHLLMKLSHLPPANSDFDSFPAQLHLYFRPSLKECMEHYQLSSHTLSLVITNEGTEQSARVAVAWPKSVISSQQRVFLRVEPRRDLPLALKVLAVPQATLHDPKNLPCLARGYVIDLSLGGIQFILKGRYQLPENQNLMLNMELSSNNSHMEKNSKPYHLNLLLEPLSADFIIADGYTDLPTSTYMEDYTVVRGKFYGRYNLLPYAQRWEQVDFSLENFKDFSHWIQGYQRFMLQNKKTKGAIRMKNTHSQGR